MLVLVTDEKHLAEILLRTGLDLGHTVQHRSFEIELHHDPDGLRQAGVHTDGEIERADLAAFDQPGERRQRLAVFTIRVGLLVVALLRRAENPLHFWVVVEEREEHGTPLDNRSPELRLDPLPVVIEPTLYGFQLSSLIRVGFLRRRDGLLPELDRVPLQMLL